jgi:hypothetical protein
MGPRPYGRGNTARGAVQAYQCRLQWGRDLMAAETLSCVPVHGGVNGFNGAATLWPRKQYGPGALVNQAFRGFRASASVFCRFIAAQPWRLPLHGQIHKAPQLCERSPEVASHLHRSQTPTCHYPIVKDRFPILRDVARMRAEPPRRGSGSSPEPSPVQDRAR